MANYSGLILAESSLQSYWRLGEASGTNAADSKGSNAGTYSGATLGQAGALPSDPNTAVLCDGIDDYVTMGDVLPMDGTQAFTLEAWVKYTSGVYIVARSNAAINNGYGLSVTAGGKIQFQRFANGSYPFVTGDVVLTAGSWTHVVATYDGDKTYKVYANGVIDKTFVDTLVRSNVAAVGTFTLGCIRYGTPLTYQSFIAATLDDVAVYNAALSAAAVASHYAEGVWARTQQQASNQALRAASF